MACAMEPQDKCPKCGKTLKLQQINLKEAIFICVDLKCPYPCYDECWTIKRDIKNIKKAIDLNTQLKKQGTIQDVQADTKPHDQSSESHLLLELNELLNSHVSSQAEGQFQVAVKNEKIAQTPQNIMVENHQPNRQVPELPELDDYLMNFL